MSPITSVVVTVLLSGVVAAIVSAFMQKHNEKEQRIFNARLEAYKEFAAHLESRFVSLTKDGKNLDITTLAEISSKCLLVSNSNLNKELKAFLAYVSEIYKKSLLPDYDEKNTGSMFEKLWNDADKVEDLMRKDLGFK